MPIVRFFMGLFLGSYLIAAGEPHVSTNPQSGQQLENRIDFGNAYIMGQSIKSGAVYLLHRKKSEIKSMLKMREDYREEILDEHTTIEPGAIQKTRNGRD